MVCACSSIFGGTSSSTRSRRMSCNGVSMAWCLVLLMVGQGLASPTPSSDKPADQQQIASANSAEIASQIVQQLQTLGNHRSHLVHSGRSSGATVALQSLPSTVHGVYEPSYYDPYDGVSSAYHDPQDTHYYKIQEPEPTPDPSLTPSGINVNGALGFISYLVLLVLLQGAIEGVAHRTTGGRRRRRDLGFTPEDLPGWPGLTNTVAGLPMLPSTTALPSVLEDTNTGDWQDAGRPTWDQDKDEERPTWQEQSDLHDVHNGHGRKNKTLLRYRKSHVQRIRSQ